MISLDGIFQLFSSLRHLWRSLSSECYAKEPREESNFPSSLSRLIQQLWVASSRIPGCAIEEQHHGSCRQFPSDTRPRRHQRASERVALFSQHFIGKIEQQSRSKRRNRWAQISCSQLHICAWWEKHALTSVKKGTSSITHLSLHNVLSGHPWLID